MRIALTHAYSWPEVRRGAERFTPSLAAALARRGHEVVHLTAAWTPGVERSGGVVTIRLRRRWREPHRHELHFGVRALRELARERFDAVHALGRWDALAAIASAWLRRDSRRTVITDLGLPDPVWWREQGRLQAWAAMRVAVGIDVYSVMSRTAVEHLERGYGRADGVVVPGGVDLGSFAPAGEREPTPTILYSGTLAEPRKGVAVLLAALALIARERPDVALWLSGPGDAEPLLAAADPAARARTRVLGLGDPQRQAERYGRAWVTCLPSTADSFGMALVESLACGTPLVATTDGAPQELVTPGVTGELCQPNDPESLAGACLRALELARDPGTVARCRAAAQPFDWDAAIAPLCERLYAEGC